MLLPELQFLISQEGSILAVVRSFVTTIKSCRRVSKITNSSGGRVSFKEQNFFFNFSPVNVPVFWMPTSHSVIPYCGKQKTNIPQTLFHFPRDTLSVMWYSQKWNVCKLNFFVGNHWCTSAMCKHKDSRSLATCEFCKMWCYFDKVLPLPWKKKKWIFQAKF